MLNVLRDSFKQGPWLKGILIAVAASLVLYLGSFFVGDQGGSAQNNWVARFDGAEVSERSFREAARNLDQNYRDLLGANFEQFRDCTVCHSVDEIDDDVVSDWEASYANGSLDPLIFAPSFGPIVKETCVECHTPQGAGDR